MKTIEQVKEKIKWLKENAKQLSNNTNLDSKTRNIFGRDVLIYKEILNYIDSKETE
jgi:hypothetical protein